jgi:hypothetical protein
LVEAIAPLDLLGDLLTTERSGLVARAVAQLPILQREAIVLFTYEGSALQIGEVIPRLSKAGMPSHSEGWGGLFKDDSTD